MAVVTAQTSVNTQTLAELSQIKVDDYDNLTFQGAYSHGPSEIKYRFTPNEIDLTPVTTFEFAGGQNTGNGAIGQIDVRLFNGSIYAPAYSVTGVNYVLGTLWADNSDGAPMSSTPATIFAGADTMTGSTFDDVLFGFAGVDLLTGNAGADVLDGGTEGDTMRGGAGDDTYVVDNVADVVDESVGGSDGVDTVQSFIDFDLQTQALGDVENLTLLGPALVGSGNGLANIIIGNAGANILDGRAGADTLNGGLGLDTLTGGSEADTFIFDAAIGKKAESLANRDTITDFAPGVDEIHLDHDIFAKINLGELKGKAFIKGKNLDQAQDGNDRIIYDKKSGELRYDKDGDGDAHARIFAVLTDSPNNLKHGDFLII